MEQDYLIDLHHHPLNASLLACRFIMQREDAQKTVERNRGKEYENNYIFYYITQAFSFAFLLLGGRIFGKTTQPFLFAVFPAASFKLSLICVTHTVCHRFHQWRPVRQFVIFPTQFTFQMLVLGAHGPLYFLQLSPAPQDRRSSAAPHQVTKGNWMLLSHLKHPLAFSCLGRRFIVKSEKVKMIPLFFSPELKEVLVCLSMSHTQLLWSREKAQCLPLPRFSWRSLGQGQSGDCVWHREGVDLLFPQFPPHLGS